MSVRTELPETNCQTSFTTLDSRFPIFYTTSAANGAGETGSNVHCFVQLKWTGCNSSNSNDFHPAWWPVLPGAVTVLPSCALPARYKDSAAIQHHSLCTSSKPGRLQYHLQLQTMNTLRTNKNWAHNLASGHYCICSLIGSIPIPQLPFVVL